MKNKTAAVDREQTGEIISQEFRTAGPEKKIAEAVVPACYAVFDVETRRSAAEVGGWHRADRMGISVAVLYDSPWITADIGYHGKDCQQVGIPAES